MNTTFTHRICLLAGVLLLGSLCQMWGASAPKREMRATWFTTVNNIDWPSSTGASAQKQAPEGSACSLPQPHQTTRR